MADEEDSFIREVNEELRRENARALWGRYGPILIGGAVALVLATAAWQGYNYWINAKAARIGGQMVKAIELDENEQYDMALGELNQIKASDFGAYPTLASFRQATILARQGAYQEAIAAFDAIRHTADAPDILKNMAALRATYLLVDHGSLADVEERVKMLASDNRAPVRLAAREALGLAAWKASHWHEATQYFEQIINDEAAARTGFSVRARQMLDLLKERAS